MYLQQGLFVRLGLNIPSCKSMIPQGVSRITRSEQELGREAIDHRSEERVLYRTAFMLCQDIIIVYSLDGRILEVNPSALNILGYPAEELEGMKVYDLLDEKGDKEYQKRVEEMKEGGGSTTFTASHMRKDGTFVDIEVNAKIVSVPSGKYIVGIGKDITYESWQQC